MTVRIVDFLYRPAKVICTEVGLGRGLGNLAGPVKAAEVPAPVQARQPALPSRSTPVRRISHAPARIPE